MILTFQYRKKAISSLVETFYHSVRRISIGPEPLTVSLAEISSSGEVKEKDVTLDDFLLSLPKKLPLRDVRLLLRPTKSNIARIPVLLPRPAAECYILDIEHIRLLCYWDRVLLFFPEKEITKIFLRDLVTDLQSGDEFRTLKNYFITKYYQSSQSKNTDFEHIILESSLDNVVKKFKRHLELMKPALDALLHKIAEDPGTHNLRNLLAFRKSLSEFEQKVGQCQRLVRSLMANDEDLVGFYLTHKNREITEHDHMELLLESYQADFEEIESEIKTFKDMIEDTNQFISGHMDSVRNNLIRMGLQMEMAAVALGSGAVAGGVFGMNLVHGLESDPAAFWVTIGGISTIMTVIFLGFNAKYNKIKLDTKNTHGFMALKNFFNYVDDLECIVNKKKMNKAEFKEALNKLSGVNITEEESEFIFKMIDYNKDGFINISEELKFRSK